MFNWVDFSIFAVILIYVIIGFNRGFILSVYGFFGFFLNLYLTITFYPAFYKVVLKYIPFDFIIKGHPFKDIIVRIVIFAILYVVIGFILKAIIGVINDITKIPVIKQLNSLGGGVAGFLEGVLVVFVILAVVRLFGDYMPKEVLMAIKSSSLGYMMFSDNPIFKLFRIIDFYKEAI